MYIKSMEQILKMLKFLFLKKSEHFMKEQNSTVSYGAILKRQGTIDGAIQTYPYTL